MRSRSLVAFLALLLPACVSLGESGRDFPSLARRPVEMQEAEGSAPASPVAALPAPADDSAALGARLDALAKQAAHGAAAFDTLYGQVAGRIRGAARAPVLSESWVAAQEDLARLEQARYDSVVALASLDTLYAERVKAVSEGGATGGVEDIQAERGRVLAAVDAQNDRVDALRGLLRRP